MQPRAFSSTNPAWDIAVFTGFRSLATAIGISLLFASPALTSENQTDSVAAAPERLRLLVRVSAAGEYQLPTLLPVFKNRDFCGANVPNETLLIAPNGGVRNAVVTLYPLGRAVYAQPRSVVLDNRRCAFVPHVQAAVAGSELRLKNSDPILHTVHARMGKETLFNVALPRWRQVSKRLERAGVVRIDCDVLHTWMSAAIMVVTTPYFAVTDDDGSVAFDELAPGAYEMQVWHERLGFKKSVLTLPRSGAIAMETVFSTSRASP
jgi:hypothetical protein